MKTNRPPKDGLIRAHPGLTLRAAADAPATAMPTLAGHFAVFGEWTEINSCWEGNFLESIAPGAFSKTIAEGRDQMRCLFQHGMEYTQGDKPLGPITALREDDTGAYYEVDLLDAPYVRELVPGLEAGLFGASFRFTVMREEFTEEPDPSDYNPKGLPERILREAKVREFGPVTWGAYPTATAGLRSLTDEFIAMRSARDPEFLAGLLERARDPEGLERLVSRSRPKPRKARMDSEDAGTLGQMLALADQYVQEQDEDDESESGTVSAMAGIQSGLIDLLAVEKAEVEPVEDETNSSAPSGETRADQCRPQQSAPPEGAGQTATPNPGRRETNQEATRAAAVKPKEIPMTLQELLARQDEIRSRLTDMDAEHGDSELPEDAQREHDELTEEQRTIKERADRIKARRDERREELRNEMTRGRVTTEDGATFNTPRNQTLNPYDIEGVRSLAQAAGSQQARAAVMRDQALRAIDSEREFAHPGVSVDGAKRHMESLLRREAMIGVQSPIAERIIATGSELYLRAFAKRVAGSPETPEEQRALATFTGAAGGFAVPYQFDPTLIPTSNLSVNPYRAIARVEQVHSNEWRGVTSGAVTPAYAVEGAEAIDNTPTLTQPVVNPERCQAFVPFSIEIEGDWPSAMMELAMLIADGKDDVEAAKFTTGLGHASNEPQGVLTGATNTVTSAGVGTVALADLYKLWETLPPRYRARAAWIGNLAMWDRIRQFDVYGGAQLFVQNLTLGMSGDEAGPAAANIGIPFLGKKAYEVSTMVSVTTTGSKVIAVGDFSRFIIVDRMGMNVEIVSHLVGTNHRPTGQRGLVRDMEKQLSAVLDANAFRTLVTA